MQKVLLVNDSKFESMIMKDMLTKIGYSVRISDEFSVTTDIKNFEPNFVFINYIMKQIRGDQLAALVKLQNSNVKCILSSCNEINSERINTKKVDAVIRTPISEQELENLFDKLKETS